MTDFRKRGFFAVDTGRKLNVHKTFRRCPGRLLNALYTFNLRPVSAGLFIYHLFLLFLCFYFGRKIVKTPFVLILENYKMVSLKFLWPGHLKRIAEASNHCVKSVQIRNFFWSIFSIFSRNARKYGPEKTPYLDTFHAVNIFSSNFSLFC